MFMGGDDLRDWSRGAEAGAAICLGQPVAALPPSTAAAVRSLSDAGVVDIARRRVGPERYSFVVQRRSTPYIDRADMRPVAPRARGGNHVRRSGVIERRVLKLLLAAANRGLPCPTNAAIARAVGLRDDVAASYRVRRLQQRGLIRVEVPSDPRRLRIVTIVASGKATPAGWL